MPEELAPAAVMRFMGWGWRDWCEAPAQLVEDVLSWMEKRAGLAAERESLRAGLRGRRRG